MKYLKEKTTIKQLISFVRNHYKPKESKKLTDDIINAIKAALKDYSEEEIIKAIRNYAEILKNNNCYFKYKWTLRDFLKRGLVKFLDIDIAKNNYSKDEINGTNRGNDKATGDTAGNSKQGKTDYTGGKYGDFVQH